MKKKQDHLIKVAGMDPSMSNWGLAIGTYNTQTDELSFDELLVVKPVINKDKKIRASTRDIQRAETLFFHIMDKIQDIDLVVAETPIAGQDSRSCVNYAMCNSLIAAMNVLRKYPIIEVSPYDVKAVVAKGAQKNDMIAWALDQHPEAQWKTRVVKGLRTIVVGHAEHVADAIAAFYAGSKNKSFLTHLENIS